MSDHPKRKKKRQIEKVNLLKILIYCLYIAFFFQELKEFNTGH